jgi:D-alanine-D-alanine ligase
VSYQAKWAPDSAEYIGTVPRCPAELDAPLADEIRAIALAAWRAVGGEGYGRVDLRVDVSGKPWLLEVNANPDIAPDAGLARMARAAGLDYTALIGKVMDAAFARRPLLAPERWADAQRLSGVPPQAPGQDAVALEG